MIATNTNFDGLLESEKLVIVDFWATWCGPCRMLSPLLDEVEEEMADKITVVKVNVDDADEIAMRYRIMSIPTLLFQERRAGGPDRGCHAQEHPRGQDSSKPVSR